MLVVLKNDVAVVAGPVPLASAMFRVCLAAHSASTAFCIVTSIAAAEAFFGWENMAANSRPNFSGTAKELADALSDVVKPLGSTVTQRKLPIASSRYT